MFHYGAACWVGGLQAGRKPTLVRSPKQISPRPCRRAGSSVPTATATATASICWGPWCGVLMQQTTQ